MTHPLTDRDVAQYVVKEIRIAYDKGSNDMLQQVRKTWQDLIDSNKTDIQVIRDFDKRLEAIRPQVVDLPQANSDVCGEEGIERARQQTFEENDELMRKLADS